MCVDLKQDRSLGTACAGSTAEETEYAWGPSRPGEGRRPATNIQGRRHAVVGVRAWRRVPGDLGVQQQPVSMTAEARRTWRPRADSSTGETREQRCERAEEESEGSSSSTSLDG